MLSIRPWFQRCIYVSQSWSFSTTSCQVDAHSRKDVFPPWAKEASLYVHWPYCKKRCTYCNFNKYVTPSIDQDRMMACLTKEIQTLIRLAGIKRVTSVFIGGGTPSLAEPKVFEAILDAVRGLVAMPTDVEVTMEANPTSLEMKKLEDFKSAGVNRLSLGIQALDNNDLKTLGREHTIDQSLACIHEAKKLFPNRLSLDIIFARPSQTLSSWKAELEKILLVCDSHISLYQLTLEPGTLLYKWNKQGLLPMPSADLIADMYETAVERLAKAGFHRYEVSNFARMLEAESTHNKAYWSGKQYIGVGPGAHGRFCLKTEELSDPVEFNDSYSSPAIKEEYRQEERTQQSGIYKTRIFERTKQVTLNGERIRGSLNSCSVWPQREARIQTLEPDQWMGEVEEYGHATRRRVALSDVDVLRELLMTGLRTQQGIPSQTWQQFGPAICLGELFGSSEFVEEAINTGLLELDEFGFRCTHRGLNVLDSLLPDLTEILHSYYQKETLDH